MQVDLRKLSHDVAKACRKHDLPMPIFVCVSSRNGSFLVVRVGIDETNVLAERIEGSGFCEPFKVMLLDQSGKTVQLATNGDANSSPLPVDKRRRRRSRRNEVRVAQSGEGQGSLRFAG